MTSDPPRTEIAQPPAKLFGSLRLKLLIAAGCLIVLALGTLTMPSPSPTPAPAPPQERAAPLLGEEVQRREQLRVFGELQSLGPTLAPHSVTLPLEERPPSFPSDVPAAAPRLDPAGHGLIVSAEGEVLTTAKALGGREEVTLELFGGATAAARVVAFDPDTDLVLLSASPIPPTSAAPWAAQPPPAGMVAVAVAHSRGRIAVAPVFVTTAVYSDTRVRTTTGDLIAGTPIFTVEGEVFAIAVGGEEASAVLIAPAMARLRQRIAAGHSRRGAIGAMFQPLEGALAEVFSTPGVLVADTVSNGPAELAGIVAGDVITAIGDTPVSGVDAALAAISALTPEQPVTVQLTRGGAPVTVQVLATSALGLRVRMGPDGPTEDAPEARRLFDAGTLGAAGIDARARVLRVNGQRVRSADEARAALQRARGRIVLHVEDDRGRSFRVVEPAR